MTPYRVEEVKVCGPTLLMHDLQSFFLRDILKRIRRTNTLHYGFLFISDAVMKIHLTKATEAEVEKEIATWLRYWRDRNGGRRCRS